MAKAQSEAWMTTRGERLSYGAYFTGQNFFYAIVSTFLSSYLLFLGVDPIKTATVMLVVKIWDAINDGVFGWIIDKVKFKKGKFMPWIRISLAFIPLTTMLMFFIPQGSPEALKLAWFAVAYILWDTAYTICDVPIFGLVTTMTNQLDERTHLMSMGRIFAGLGGGLTFALCTLFVSRLVGLSFGWSSVVLSIAGVACMLPLCFKGRERNFVLDSEEKFKIKEMFRYLGKNKFLLIYYLGYFVCYGLATANALQLFVAYYMFDSELVYFLLMAITLVPAVVLAFFVPKIVKKVDKFRFFFLCNVFCAVMGVVVWLVGYQNLWLHVALATVKSIPMGAIGVLMFMFTPDCAEYGKYKTGTDAKGITFSIQTFVSKLGSALAGSLGLFVLGAFGWITINVENFSELASSGVVQPQSAMNGLWFAYALLPALGNAAACIIWSFYKLRDKDVQLMSDCNAGLITREEAEAKLSRKY